MANALRNVGTKRTPQRERADKIQIKNETGGYVFETSPATQFHRFLTLGVTGPTYYVSERKLANDALALVKSYVESAGVTAVHEITQVSLEGRAPKQDPALFALAVASVHGDEDTRRAAYAALPQVARTGSALFSFAQFRSQFGGWSRGYRNAVERWYLGKNVDQMAYQMVKYRQRDGFDHRRLLQTAHPKPDTAERDAMFRWALGKGDHVDPSTGEEITPDVPAILVDYLDAKAGGNPVEIINRGHGVSWEMLPTQALNQPEVWAALIEQGLPITALIRQLPRLTNLGLVRGETGKLIKARLTDGNVLSRGRIHPINVLAQARTYRKGVGKGQSWTPDGKVLDALDEAFYLAFKGVRPSGKRLCLGLDVSGSMGMSTIDNMGGLTPREASAALALVQMSTEQDCEVIGFTGNRRTLNQNAGWGHYRQQYSRDGAVERIALSSRQRLDDAIKLVSELPFGPTDCALPMTWAMANGVLIDTFVIYTDNQTNVGPIHVHQALKQYRDRMGVDARLIVVAMTPPLNQTIADPRDPRTLDVSGFDSAVPNLITDFAGGIVG